MTDTRSPMIPGAFSPRATRPGSAAAPGRPAAPDDPPPAVVDRARLEREREGGGAPSQRPVRP